MQAVSSSGSADNVVLCFKSIFLNSFKKKPKQTLQSLLDFQKNKDLLYFLIYAFLFFCTILGVGFMPP